MDVKLKPNKVRIELLDGNTSIYSITSESQQEIQDMLYLIGLSIILDEQPRYIKGGKVYQFTRFEVANLSTMFCPNCGHDHRKGDSICFELGCKCKGY